MTKRILDNNKTLRKRLRTSSKNQKRAQSIEKEIISKSNKENDRKLGQLFQRCAELQQLLEERESQLKICEKLLNTKKEQEILSVNEDNSSFLNEIEIIALNSQNENHSSTTPCFRSIIKSLDNDRSWETSKSNKFKENIGIKDLNIMKNNLSQMSQKNQIYYIDQNAPRNQKTSANFSQNGVNLTQSQRENESLLNDIKKVVQEYEEIHHSGEIVEYIKEAFAKSTKYDDINSILQYSMKLLKCDDMSQIIHKVKALQKQALNPRKPEKENYNSNVKTQGDKEISSLIEKLRDISGLDKNYDNLLVLKCLIKYFDRYTSHKF